MAATVGWRIAGNNGSSLGNDPERNGDSKLNELEPPTPHAATKMGLRERTSSSMEDPDGTLASVAQCIEQLRQHSSTAQEKENLLMQLLELIITRENALVQLDLILRQFLY
ncbi:unnamed protein product [Rhodiola kirilowii]